MKGKIWTNKVAWLKLVYPHIVSWATDMDYNIPSVSTLAKYTVKFLDCESYKSVYNGEEITAIGTHYSHIKNIKIAGLRKHLEIMSTLIHEFGHAVQLFSLGSEFDMAYTTESNNVKHSENEFEKACRALEAKMHRWLTRDSFFKEEIDNFIFEFEKHSTPPAPKPKPKPSPMFGYTEPYYSYFYEPEYYENPFSKNWWDRSTRKNRKKSKERR
jgi:hypothetical protein